MGTPRKQAPDSERALLDAIWAAPDAREPRLVYADLLQQRGDPRGEYMALRLSGATDDKARRRALVLEKKHAGTWLGAARPYVFAWAFDFGGLVETVCCQAVKLVEGFDAIASLQPRLAIEIASLRVKKLDTLAKLAKLELTRGHEVRIWTQELDDRALATLAPALGRCRRLSLGGAFGAPGLRALEPHVANVEHILLRKWTNEEKTGLDQGPAFSEIPTIASKLTFEQPYGARAYRC